VSALTASAQTFPDSVYTPLWNYNGTWKVALQGKSPDVLINHCTRTGLFFACEQNVNGNPGALVVFIPIDAEGHYKTNPITTNDFSDDSHIHFEQSQSTDKIHWEVQRSGDEVRTDKGAK
jgi:hypothetical protein